MVLIYMISPYMLISLPSTVKILKMFGKTPKPHARIAVTMKMLSCSVVARGKNNVLTCKVIRHDLA